MATTHATRNGQRAVADLHARLEDELSSGKIDDMLISTWADMAIEAGAVAHPVSIDVALLYAGIKQDNRTVERLDAIAREMRRRTARSILVDASGLVASLAITISPLFWIGRHL